MAASHSIKEQAMKSVQKSILIAAMLSLGAIGTSAMAQPTQNTQWQKSHPRRAEVNHRLKNQDRRIKEEVKEGELSRVRAKQLRTEDRQIRREERDMARQNGGHITKQEQRVLNRQENAVSRQIPR
jgi:hypothetical protein